MKKCLFGALVLAIALPLAAQDTTKKRDYTVEEAAGTNHLLYEDGGFASPGLSGNLFMVNWGVYYRVDRLPAYSLGAGMQFTLSNRIGIETAISLLNGKVSSDDKYESAVGEVSGGSTTFADVDIFMRIFATRMVWFGFGFSYETLIDGHYVDDDGTNYLHREMTKEDEPNKLAFKIGVGLLSPISRENYAIPALTIRYNIPVDSKFDQKDIYAGVSFGMAVRLGEGK
jgi:hypothetical protein